MTTSKIQVEYADDVLVIRLNLPEKLNAVSAKMVAEINTALDEAEGRARAMVLTGNGRAFCSGAELDDPDDDTRAMRPRDYGGPLEAFINPLMSRLRGLPFPWITMVRGGAAGVGCSIALAGDMVVVSETAYFLQAFSRIGLAPDGGSSYLLPRSIGRVRASEMMLLADRVPAAQALEWGMVNRVVPDDQLETVGMELARRLASGPTRTLALTRKLCWDGLENDWDTVLQAEREVQRQVGHHDDSYEGIAAFLEKRPARFTGS